jgi:Ca2+-binding EF-hand superfamily protein
VRKEKAAVDRQERREAAWETQSTNLHARLASQKEQIEKLRKALAAKSRAHDSVSRKLAEREQRDNPTILRLQKMGLNPEQVADLQEVWVGRAVQEIVRELRASDTTMRAAFTKYEHAKEGYLDEPGFRALCMNLCPHAVRTNLLTRLFYFISKEQGGEVRLSFSAFLRVFGTDEKGDMGDEYFEVVMAQVHKAVVKSGGLGRLVRLEGGGGASMDASLRREDFVNLIESLTGVTRWPVSRHEAHQIYNRLDPSGKEDVKTESVAEALKQCANRNFVTLDWVQEVFEKIAVGVQTQGRSLEEALVRHEEAGAVSAATVRDLFHAAKPDLKEAQVDRLINFLDPQNLGKVPFVSLFQINC